MSEAKQKPEKPRPASKERHYGLPISPELEQEIADVAIKAAKVGMSTAGLRQLVGHRVSEAALGNVRTWFVEHMEQLLEMDEYRTQEPG